MLCSVTSVQFVPVGEGGTADVPAPSTGAAYGCAQYCDAYNLDFDNGRFSVGLRWENMGTCSASNSGLEFPAPLLGSRVTLTLYWCVTSWGEGTPAGGTVTLQLTTDDALSVATIANNHVATSPDGAWTVSSPAHGSLVYVTLGADVLPDTVPVITLECTQSGCPSVLVPVALTGAAVQGGDTGGLPGLQALRGVVKALPSPSCVVRCAKDPCYTTPCPPPPCPQCSSIPVILSGTQYQLRGAMANQSRPSNTWGFVPFTGVNGALALLSDMYTPDSPMTFFVTPPDSTIASATTQFSMQAIPYGSAHLFVEEVTQLSVSNTPVLALRWGVTLAVNDLFTAYTPLEGTDVPGPPVGQCVPMFLSPVVEEEEDNALGAYLVLQPLVSEAVVVLPRGSVVFIKPQYLTELYLAHGVRLNVLQPLSWFIFA